MNLFEYTYELVRQIPEGRISSYGALARALGDIIASRAVGRMMNQNPDPDNMPCYKIVHSDGSIGGFGRGIDDKIRRLKEDNIFVKNGKIVDFEKVFFNDFKTNYPLKKLREKQIRLSKKIKIIDYFDEIETVAGFDVAYPKNDFKKACAAAVITDYKTKKIVEKKTFFDTILFPYIPSYLSFREAPIIKKIMDNLENSPSVFMFDGNGILHNRRLGIASYMGVLNNIPSIGVAKKLLVGQLRANIIEYKNKKIGYSYLSNKRVKNPVYISPGHKISFDKALEIVKNVSEYRIPQPIRQAHILANETIRS